MANSDHYYAVILAGGGGTRLWPQSRKKSPKHLLDLLGTGSLLRLTFNNFTPIIPKERILIVTLKDHYSMVKKELPELPEENIMCEPMGKNTAMAMGFAAAVIHKRDPKAVIIHEAADHLYDDLGKLHETVLGSLEVAEKGDFIVAIGIKPTFPHTGLGYIRTGGQLDECNGMNKKNYVFKCKGFKEKPDLTTAQSFVNSKEYLWNANLYGWSTKTIFEALQNHSPKIYKAVKRIYDFIGDKREKEVIEEVYKSLNNPLSIDYEVSEKAKNIVVIPGNFGWSDVGDWKVVYETLPKDRAGNAINCDEHILIDSKNVLMEGGGRLLVAVGVSDLIIVDTENAVLVCSKDRAQDVKKVVEKLKEEKKDKYL